MFRIFNRWHYSLISIITGVLLIVFINATYTMTIFRQNDTEYLTLFGIIVIAEFGILGLTIYYSVKKLKLSSAMKSIIYGGTFVLFPSLAAGIYITDGNLQELLRSILVTAFSIYCIAVGFWAYLKSGSDTISGGN